MLWLVSGDAIEVIDAMFIAPLGDLGDYAYYVVSSGGYRGDRVQNGRRTRVFQQEPLSPATREQLLNLAEAMIVSGT